MARIRTVKPDIARHEGLFKLEQETRLPLRFAWCMLFTVADREGRFMWRPRPLKTDVLPYDEIEFEDVLDALEGGGFIVRYEVDGELYGYIPSWKKHQTINVREAGSRIPEPPVGSGHVHARAFTGAEPAGKNIPVELRDTVHARDKYVCLRCGARECLTIDHIFPTCIGGTDVITNLRTLCKSCNCARPVGGQALIDDLAKDGLTLDDMKRTCSHVHARGEGKGREGKGTRVDDASANADCPETNLNFEGPSDEIPLGLDLTAWERWRSYRISTRKPLKPVSLPAAQRQLAAFGSDQAAVVEQSIANGWQGLFALKSNGNGHGEKPKEAGSANGLRCLNP